MNTTIDSYSVKSSPLGNSIKRSEYHPILERHFQLHENLFEQESRDDGYVILEGLIFMVSWSNDGEPVRWHSAYEWAPNIPEDAVKGFIAWSEFHKHIPRDGYSTPSAIFSPNYQNRLKIAWKSLSYLLNHELTDGETVDFLNREVRNDLWTTQSTMRGSLERADHLIHSQADSSISLNGSPSVCLDISFDAVHQLAHAIRRRVTKQLQVILD